MKLIVLSEANTASKNICKVLLKKYPELEKHIFRITEDVIDLDNYESELERRNPEIIIVASSHKSEKGTNSLSCHATGNFHSNDLGGKSEKLSIAPALHLRTALLELKNQQSRLKLNKYEVTLEVTHHSPTIDLPVIFIEVGSNEKQWNDMKACEAAAEAIQCLMKRSPQRVPVAVGFGGSHYAPTFTRRVLESNIAFGHIFPRYALDEGIDERMVIETIENNLPTPNFAVIEWKGTNRTQRDELIEIFEKNRIHWKRDKDIK